MTLTASVEDKGLRRRRTDKLHLRPQRLFTATKPTKSQITECGDKLEAVRQNSWREMASCKELIFSGRLCPARWRNVSALQIALKITSPSLSCTWHERFRRNAPDNSVTLGRVSVDSLNDRGMLCGCF